MAKKNELTHLAIILDGNGRWAEKHGVPRVKGHEAGAERVMQIVKDLKDFLSIRYLTLYAFSTENWNRSEEEVSALMDLLCKFLDQHYEALVENKIRLLVAGQREKMPLKCLERIDKVTALTSKNYERTVIFAINYGGRQEITDAVRKIAEKVKSGSMSTDEISEKEIFHLIDLVGRLELALATASLREALPVWCRPDLSGIKPKLDAENLYHPDVPDPDLLIRTSGEVRISNFLLWQISYSELYFTDVLWPDFDKTELEKAIDSYYNRDRRFGGRK